MKKYILTALALLLAAVVCWCVIMDPVSVHRENVGSIDICYSYAIADADGNPASEESTFTVTDENQIRYITDFLNNLLPIPGNTAYPGFHRILTLRDRQGKPIAEITLYGHKHFITDKGTFRGDVSELNSNLTNLENHGNIVNNRVLLPLMLICWLVVIVIAALAGLLLFLIQMGICAKTDSLALRLLPTLILLLLCLFNFRISILTGIFYLCSMLIFDQPWIGVILLVAAAVISIVLGWRQGDGMRKQK